MEIAGLGLNLTPRPSTCFQGIVFPRLVTSGGEGFGAFNTYSLSWVLVPIFFMFGSSVPCRESDHHRRFPPRAP